MAGTSLLALIDDIASILDDVSVMTKAAATKTVGVLGDDLALNAQQVTGVQVDRELPVVWAVALGSLRNKAILVPAALAISAVAPWGVTPLLMIGGAYLCLEGCEKLAHKFLHPPDEEARAREEQQQALQNPAVDMRQYERDKIRGAVRTDFILSAEIIVIALGTVAHAPFAQRVAVLVAIGLLMTVGVYGLVAAIVKLDDAGLYLSTRQSDGAAPLRALGRGLLTLAPWLMKILSVVGTAAMFLVGGTILLHGVPAAHHLVEHLGDALHGVPGVGGLLSAASQLLAGALIGVMAGAICLIAYTLGRRALGKTAH